MLTLNWKEFKYPALQAGAASAYLRNVNLMISPQLAPY